MSVALDLFSPRMVAERRGDGVLVLRSADPLGGHAPGMPTRSAPAPWHIPAASPPPSAPATNGSASAGARRAMSWPTRRRSRACPPRPRRRAGTESSSGTTCAMWSPWSTWPTRGSRWQRWPRPQSESGSAGWSPHWPDEEFDDCLVRLMPDSILARARRGPVKGRWGAIVRWPSQLHPSIALHGGPVKCAGQLRPSPLRGVASNHGRAAVAGRGAAASNHPGLHGCYDCA